MYIFSSLSYPSHWIAPGLTSRAGLTVTGFWWKEKMPPMLISPSLENWDSSFVPYVWHTGFSPPTAKSKTNSRLAISSIVPNLSYYRTVTKDNPSKYWPFYRSPIRKSQGLYAMFVKIIQSPPIGLLVMWLTCEGLVGSSAAFVLSITRALQEINQKHVFGNFSWGVFVVFYLFYFVDCDSLIDFTKGHEKSKAWSLFKGEKSPSERGKTTPLLWQSWKC